MGEGCPSNTLCVEGLELAAKSGRIATGPEGLEHDDNQVSL